MFWENKEHGVWRPVGCVSVSLWGVMGTVVGKGFKDPEREASERWLLGPSCFKITRGSSSVVTLLMDQTGSRADNVGIS